VRRRTKRLEITNTDILAAGGEYDPEEITEGSGRRFSVIDSKRMAKQRKKERKKRAFTRVLVFLFLVLALLLFLRSKYFEIKDIKVEGMSYYSGSEIVSMSGATPGRNLIFDPGKKEIEEALAGNPYFKSVEVKRKLPSTLIIEVEERAQIAAVIFGDGYIVIDDEGVVLRRAEVDPRLTLLTGLTVSKMNVGEALEAEESETLSMTLRMLTTMRDGDMYFKKIDVSKVVIKAYIYDNLIVKGTPSEMTEAIESGKLQAVVANLFKDGISRGTITMGGDGYTSFSPELIED